MKDIAMKFNSLHYTMIEVRKYAGYKVPFDKNNQLRRASSASAFVQSWWYQYANEGWVHLVGNPLWGRRLCSAKVSHAKSEIERGDKDMFETPVIRVAFMADEFHWNIFLSDWSCKFSGIILIIA